MLLVEHFMPAHEGVLFQKARLERRLAALQCVEAIRLYAAAHGGRLPGELSDIRATPVPGDPLTGRAFDYTAQNNSARLYGAPSPGEPDAERNVVHYQITMARETTK